jgi:serine/threonine-protein kinase
VLDFGIAGGVDATRLTQAGEVFGTPQYMSPEQCNGLPLDHRTDIYSLACILYEMIEGRPPFSAETPMATMLKHVRAKVPLPRHAGKDTARVVLMGLRKDRAKRIQTAGKFAELLGFCIGQLRAAKEGRLGENSAARPLPTPGTGPSPIVTTRTPIPPVAALGPTRADRRGATVAIALGAAAIVLVLLMVFGDFGGSRAPSEPVDAPTPTKAAAEPDTSGKSHPFNRALVRSNEAGATVLVDGVEQCKTPCEIKVPVGDEQTHEIRLVKAGFIDVVVNWRPRNVGDPLPALPDMKPL